MSDWLTISTGANHSMGIRADGSLWAWGDNSMGQVGTGSASQQYYTFPAKIDGGLLKWISVAGGAMFTIAIKEDGTLWSWGENIFGQLGRSGTLNRPGQVGMSADWKFISAGNSHALGIKNDGSLWAWGYNGSYQLGDGTTTSRVTPTQIGNDTDWEYVSAGYDFSIALKTDGSLWVWGDNDMGQLGNGTYNQVMTPTKLGSDSWKSVAASNMSVTAIKANGTLWNWGWVIGGFGLDLQNTSNSPLQIGSATSWHSIIAGDVHAFVFAQDETLWGWGEGTWGKLGDNSWETYTKPVQLSPGIVSGNSNQVLCSDATIADIEVTGANIQWFLTPSEGSPLPSNFPLTNETRYYANSNKFGCISSPRFEVIVNLKTPTPKPSGNTHQSFCKGATIADIGVDGTNIRWYNTNSSTSPISTNTPLVNGSHYFVTQTIDGCESLRLDIQTTVSTPPPPSGPSSQIVCSGTRLFALQANGENIRWYGSKFSFEHTPLPDYFLYGSSTKNFYATQTIDSCESEEFLEVQVMLTTNSVTAPISSTALTADKIFAKSSSANVIDLEGRLWGWGWGWNFQLDSTRENKISPVVVDSGPWKAIASGDEHTLGIKKDGTLWAWGYNYEGQLGLGDSTPNYISHMQQVGIESNWHAITTEYKTSAGVKTNGTLWTWGGKDLLGIGYVNYNENSPVQVSPHNTWTDVSSGSQFMHGIKDTQLSGWGTNFFGELGDGTNEDRFKPTFTQTAGWKMVRGGYRFAAGITLNGELFTWGSNENGGLANGSPTSTRLNTPTKVGNDQDWQFLALGFSHGLAVKTDGTLWAWGSNSHYQLGNGTTTNSLIPIQIGIDTDWKEVAAGDIFSMAMKGDGTVWTWGISNVGQTGHGSTTTFKVPTMVSASLQLICDQNTVGDLNLDGENIQIYDSPNSLYPLKDETPLVDRTLYYATQTVDGCESQKRHSIFVLKKDSGLPAPTGKPIQEFCPGAIAKDLIAIGNGIEWYEVPSGGSALSESTPLVNNMTYYASQGIGLCKSSDRLEIKVLIETGTENPPTGQAVQRLCTGSLLSNLVTNEPNIAWYDTASGGSELPLATILVDGKHYFAALKSENCESSRFKITVSLVPNDPPIVEDQIFCHNATVYDLHHDGGNIRYFYDLTSLESLAPTNMLMQGYYFASQIIENCESERAPFFVQLIDVQAPDGETIQSYEIGKTLNDLQVVGENINWYASPEDIGIVSKRLSPFTILEENMTYYASQTVNDCESSSGLPVTVITIVTNVLPELKLETFPNPIVDKFIISTDQILQEVFVFNMLGNVLLWKEIKDTQTQIDFSALPMGTYFIKLVFNDRVKVLKVQKL
jgi:alpha-tubulin suppressor-like RCC1 family protein